MLKGHFSSPTSPPSLPFFKVNVLFVFLLFFLKVLDHFLLKYYVILVIHKNAGNQTAL